MINNIERDIDGLPVIPEKELVAINRLLSSNQYRIKERDIFLRSSKKDLVSSSFVIGTLNDFVEHIYALMAATKRMIPNDDDSFFDMLKHQYPTAAEIIKRVLNIDLKTLNNRLTLLQAAPRNVSVGAMQPFLKTFYRQLICFYYLGAEHTSSCLMATYRFLMDNYVPANPEGLREDTMKAVQEFNYIYSKIFPSMYPLVLRMTSSVMLSEHDLFYKNGSKVLAWLEVMPDEIIFPVKENPESSTADENTKNNVHEESPQIPASVYNGLEMLEHLFPEAGWAKMLAFPDESVDFAPYFASIFRFSNIFIQLNPDHPLHFPMILFHILSDLFLGLRHVTFNAVAGEQGIYQILDDWIMYMENIFNKNFGDNLNAYTYQIFNRPEFANTTLADKLMASMYSTIRSYFLPHLELDMRFYSLPKPRKERLPPLCLTVKRLHEILETSIRHRATEQSEFAKAENAFALYNFDVPSVVSTRLDAFYSCTGRTKTNRALIKCCVSILAVLDWWLNDADSPAYRAYPKLIYRTAEGEDITPVFVITKRNDISEIFNKSLKRISLGENAKKPPV